MERCDICPFVYMLHTHTGSHAPTLTGKMKAHIDVSFRLLEKAFGLSKAAVSEVLSRVLVPVDYRPYVFMSQ